MKLTYGKALQQALYDELDADNNVVLFGEDIRYNLYGYTDGFVDKFGEKRVIDLPLSEAGAMGTVAGSAMCGLKPVIDLTVPNFLYVAMDQISSIIAKTHYMYNGAYNLPLTILTSSLCGSGSAAQHSDRLHSTFSTIAGLKIITPATPQDMYSMMREAIQDDNPVMCFADRKLFWREEEVSFEPLKLIGKSNVVKKGTDITIVTVSGCLYMVKDILEEIEKLNINPEIIDIRSVVPLDFETIKQSVQKTGRVLICDTANKTSSTASEIAALLSEYAFDALKAPISIVANENIPVPFEKTLEQEIIVTKEKILDKIRRIYVGT